MGCVTCICTTCFTARAVIIAYSAFHRSATIDMLVRSATVSAAVDASDTGRASRPV